MKLKVTLKADLGAGTLFWVSEVESNSEEAAIVAAEALFLETLDGGTDWAFTDFDITPRADSVSR